jgi:hypothetical protein
MHSKGATHLILTRDTPNNPDTIDLHYLTPLEKKLGVRQSLWLYKFVSHNKVLTRSLHFVTECSTLNSLKTVSIKTNLDNYERLIYPREHIQNIRSLLELITQDIDVMCKVLLIALCESAHVWYHSLEPSFIL